MVHFDALDELAVEGYAGALAAWMGGIDMALYAFGILHAQGTPFASQSLEDDAHRINAHTRRRRP